MVLIAVSMPLLTIVSIPLLASEHPPHLVGIDPAGLNLHRNELFFGQDRQVTAHGRPPQASTCGQAGGRYAGNIVFAGRRGQAQQNQPSGRQQAGICEPGRQAGQGARAQARATCEALR